VNCGPTRWSAFHVTGAMFDTVYTQPGTYPIVSHSFAYTELGVVGLLEVTE
jgi:hypothetical protein